MIERCVSFLLEGGDLSQVTERHLDLCVFGKVFEPLKHFVYREVQSRVSKNKRQSMEGKRGYLVDYYLRLVRILLGESLRVSYLIRTDMLNQSNWV